MAATLSRHMLALIVAAICVIGNAGAAQRTFVSTSGDDLNGCDLAAPCRGFARAITQTDVGGEIVALDSGGYGAVTVNKNVSIISPAGVYAGISVFATFDGITVVAPATKVVLRGLTINGQGGNNGVRVQAGEVHIESNVISNLGAAGILVEGGSSVRVSGTVVRSNADGLRVLPAAGAVSVLVRDSEFSNHSGAGIAVSPVGAGINALVTVERSSVMKNGVGITANGGSGASATVVVTQSLTSENTGAGVASGGSGATLYVRESAVTRNGVGLFQAGSSILNACGGNLLVANSSATIGVINMSSCLDVASASGTVTSVATGPGLTGGPITTTGTINLATTNLLPTSACAPNQIPKWNGAAWACAADNDTNSGGTVTNIATGTGLTGGPITTTGTVSIANGGVGPAQLANGSVDVTKLDLTSTDARYFKQGGNSFNIFGQIGTNDNRSMELKANGVISWRIDPTAADPPNGFDTATPNLIGGWIFNSASAGVIGATIGGGGGQLFGTPHTNRVTDHYGTVGGGWGNTAGDFAGTVHDSILATVGGGQDNTASGQWSTVGGGRNNIASGNASSTVGGGQDNTASGGSSFVGGGLANTASGDNGTVGGGVGNMASYFYSTVGGGFSNIASGEWSTVGGGDRNTASGDYSIAGGSRSEARGDYSIALGRRAKTFSLFNNGTGAIVLADSNDFDFNEFFDNRFAVRSTGGVRFVLGIDGTGAATYTCSASNGSAWACASDRNLKHSLVALDGRRVLERLSAVPIYQWQPKGPNAHVKHYGPMAQDFHAAFGLGDDEKMIGMQDADGVALAAIQGLHAELRDRDATIAAQAASIAALETRMAAAETMRDELAALHAAVAALHAETTTIAAR